VTRLPQPCAGNPHRPASAAIRAASFKSLYRKRANTPCSCRHLAPSRFRYNPKTSRELQRIGSVRRRFFDVIDCIYIDWPLRVIQAQAELLFERCEN
jgi:hypothetical protein